MESCLFCKIVNGELASEKIYEDEHLIVFKDIHPVAPVHALIVPKTHYTNILEMVKDEKGRELLTQVASVLPDIVKACGLQERGFRLVNNCGIEGGQTVPHVHFHLIGGKALGPKL